MDHKPNFIEQTTNKLRLRVANKKLKHGL